MLPDYKDILDKIPEKPTWYDVNGVPRYCKFEHDKVGIYAHYVAYMEIACQLCHKRFNVAISLNNYDLYLIKVNLTLPSPGNIGSFHYGDPPAHWDEDSSICSGATMNVDDLRVLEFWQFNKNWGWERLAASEVEIERIDE